MMILLQLGRLITAVLAVLWCLSLFGAIFRIMELPPAQIAWRLPLMVLVTWLPIWAYKALTRRVEARKAAAAAAAASPLPPGT